MIVAVLGRARRLLPNAPGLVPVPASGRARACRARAVPGPLRRAPGVRLPVTQHGSACAGAVARLSALCAGNPAPVRSAVIRAVLPAIFAGNQALVTAACAGARLPATRFRRAEGTIPGGCTPIQRRRRETGPHAFSSTTAGRWTSQTGPLPSVERESTAHQSTDPSIRRVCYEGRPGCFHPRA